MTLVDIKGLKVDFAQHGGAVQAVRGVSLHVDEGESLGIVGESGSGKSVTFMALLRLLGATAKVTAESHDARRRRCSQRRPPHAVGDARQIRRDGVPGSDDRVRSGLHHRPPDRRDHPHAPQGHEARGAGRSRAPASSASRSATRAMCSATTRTSCPAACCSAR